MCHDSDINATGTLKCRLLNNETENDEISPLILAASYNIDIGENSRFNAAYYFIITPSCGLYDIFGVLMIDAKAW